MKKEDFKISSLNMTTFKQNLEKKCNVLKTNKSEGLCHKSGAVSNIFKPSWQRNFFYKKDCNRSIQKTLSRSSLEF